MPAEWEPHEATWISWPHADGISFPGIYEKVLPTFARMVDALAESEEVRINVRDQAEEDQVRHILQTTRSRHDHVRFFHVPTNEPWCRDHGPIFVTRKDAPKLAITDWGYNAWGYKYPPFDLDDAVPAKLSKMLDLPIFYADMILEGGAIDCNGEGALLTTTSCLLNPNRNPQLSQKQIEANLRDFLGVEQIIWLGDGIEGDDTDGHIDDLTRFVDPKTVVTVVEENEDDENFMPLADNLKRLENVKIGNEELYIYRLPMPSKIVRDGLRLPASYANFYIANKVVLMPAFADSNDNLARTVLQKCFPDREVLAIDCRQLIWGLGAFHCLTQQQPAV